MVMASEASPIGEARVALITRQRLPARRKAARACPARGSGAPHPSKTPEKAEWKGQRKLLPYQADATVTLVAGGLAPRLHAPRPDAHTILLCISRSASSNEL